MSAPAEPETQAAPTPVFRQPPPPSRLDPEKHDKAPVTEYREWTVHRAPVRTSPTATNRSEKAVAAEASSAPVEYTPLTNGSSESIMSQLFSLLAREEAAPTRPGTVAQTTTRYISDVRGTTGHANATLTKIATTVVFDLSRNSPFDPARAIVSVVTRTSVARAVWLDRPADPLRARRHCTEAVRIMPLQAAGPSPELLAAIGQEARLPAPAATLRAPQKAPETTPGPGGQLPRRA